MKCPICGDKLYNRTWHEEYHGVVETIEKCLKCGEYLNHWAYGRQKLEVGKWGVEFYSGSREAINYFKEFEKRIPRLRKYYKRIGKFKRGA